MKGGAGSVIRDTRVLAEKLIQGSSWVNSEVEKGIKAFGAKIENLGERVKPASK